MGPIFQPVAVSHFRVALQSHQLIAFRERYNLGVQSTAGFS
jgi:hypothetical protein